MPRRGCRRPQSDVRKGSKSSLGQSQSSLPVPVVRTVTDTALVDMYCWCPWDFSEHGSAESAIPRHPFRGQNDEDGLPAGPSYVGGHYVCGVAVQRNPGTVIAHRRARIGVARRFLHVAERHACVEGRRFQQFLRGRVGRLPEEG